MFIKAIDTIQEIKQIPKVEAETWGMQPGTTVPDHILTAFARDGGVLLGAYEDDRLIGFTLGWLGTVDPDILEPAAQQLKLVSHMTGVLARYRDQRVGYQLKLAQREWALGRGLELITWTYDPLESRNGYFNIHLLGCTCNTYLEDYYGEMSDAMNQGIPSDRFRVDWWINSQEVESTLNTSQDHDSPSSSIKDHAEQGIVLINQAKIDTTGMIRPLDRFELVDDSGIMVEIPPDYQALRNRNLDTALAWRMHTRELFMEYFGRGYRVVDFIYQRSPDPRSFYHLEKSL